LLKGYVFLCGARALVTFISIGVVVVVVQLYSRAAVYSSNAGKNMYPYPLHKSAESVVLLSRLGWQNIILFGVAVL